MAAPSDRPTNEPSTRSNDSAGIVLWRERGEVVEILLAHPGGPFWAKKDEHGWSVPKGEFTPGDEPADAAARREVAEELAVEIEQELVPLAPFRAGRKRLHLFAHCLDDDPAAAAIDAALDRVDPADQHRSMVEMEWPPRSGTMQSFPEVDRVQWVPLDDAEWHLHKGQRPVVELIRRHLAERDPTR